MKSRNTLTEAEMISLRRQFNKKFESVGVDTFVALQKFLGEDKGEENFIYFFCISLYYRQLGMGGAKWNLPSVLHDVYKNKDTSLLRRFNIALHHDIKSDSMFLYRLGQVIKQLNALGYRVHEDRLLEDLCKMYTSEESSTVKYSWISQVYSDSYTKKDNNKNDVGGNENG